jgi:hypothetical protein
MRTYFGNNYTLLEMSTINLHEKSKIAEKITDEYKDIITEYPDIPNVINHQHSFLAELLNHNTQAIENEINEILENDDMFDIHEPVNQILDNIIVFNTLFSPSLTEKEKEAYVLAIKICHMVYDYDPYGYFDECENNRQLIQDNYEIIMRGDIDYIVDNYDCFAEWEQDDHYEAGFSEYREKIISDLYTFKAKDTIEKEKSVLETIKAKGTRSEKNVGQVLDKEVER